MQDEQGRIWKFQEIRGFFFARYRVCTKAIIISNGSWENGEPKIVILMSVQKAHFPVRGCKVPDFMQRRTGPNMEIWGNSRLLFTRYRVCTKVLIISKASWANGEPKNLILVSVQNTHFPVRCCKLPGFMQCRIGRSMKISGNSGLPFPTVPCLHQGNNYIKKKLREWRA